MTDFTICDKTEMPYLYAEGTSSMDPAEISARMGEAFGRVFAFMRTQGIERQGPRCPSIPTTAPTG